MLSCSIVEGTEDPKYIWKWLVLKLTEVTYLNILIKFFNFL